MSAPSNEDFFGVMAFAIIIGLLFRSFLALLIAIAVAIFVKEM